MVRNSSNSSREIGNTSQSPPAKHWCFTLNNYTKEDISRILQIPFEIVPTYVFQEEIGEKGEREDNDQIGTREGTPHLQGYICFDKKRRPIRLFTEFLGHSRTHWSKTRNITASIQYCQKLKTRSGETFYRGIQKPYKINIDLKDWQIKVDKALLDEPDDRTIMWLWEPEGCVGKTTFAKWLYLKHKGDIYLLSGKASDMKNALIGFHQRFGKPPKIVLINIPRHSLDYVSYTGIEEIKDMFFYSGKYEGGMICGPNPHVVVFANREPNYESMSQDRWNVIRI